MFKRIGAVALSVLVAATVIASGSPASAADGWQRAGVVSEQDAVEPLHCHPSDYAVGCFQPYGEWIWLYDTSANNIPVAVKWNFRPKGSSTVSRSGVVYNDRGMAAGYTAINKSFGDGGIFSFQTCQADLPTKTTKDCNEVLRVTT
ncbi:hypothetical protein AB0J82_15445 [Asanoa sp. NPDC049518]|uniref:hypothetical protein n=1 Tax=unclassified Asanoa TaxID=2685164 RepID=UPI00342E98F8